MSSIPAAASDRSVVEHGGVRAAELRALGIEPGSVIDFSASVNPLGPSPRVREALAALDLSRYPDAGHDELRAALAERAGAGVAPENIVPGNGATELIYLAARAVLAPGDPAAVLVPTFGEYERAIRLAGGRPVAVPATLATRSHLPSIIGALTALRPALTFVCNPNNPTSEYLSEADVRAIAGAAAGVVVLDEAYVPFVDGAWAATPLLAGGRVILLRSLTKDLGLAGLRLGYIIAPPPLAGAIRAQQPSWSVNAAALVAGMAGLADEAHSSRSLAAIREGRAVLVAGLARLGLPFEPPAANFVLTDVGDGAAVRLALLHQGFAVRDCASFGLPSHIRIAARTAAECAALLTALARTVQR